MRLGKFKAFIFFIFFISGAAGLIYEVLWTRDLILIFGSTAYAVSTVLTAFMTGLALGSYLIGRYADRMRNPLKWYGFLEIGIGLYAFLIPTFFKLLVPFYQFIHAHFEPSFYVFSLTRFAMIFFILIVPTAFMGATLPVLSRFLEVPGPDIYRFVGLLYGLNTAGAVLGTFSAGFLLLPSFGSHRTNLMAVVANLMIGTVALLLSRRGRETTGSKEPTDARKKEAAAAAPAAHPPHLVTAVLIGFFLSGLVALGYEVLWMRVLGLILGPSTYAFSAMLTIFLLGLALGSLVVSHWLARIRRPALWFAGIQLAVGLLSFLGMALFHRLPFWFVDLVGPLMTYPNLVLAMKFVFSAMVILVPTLLLGAVFPLVVKVCRERWVAIGKTVGSLYAINTFGAIVGAFLGGFVILPFLGVQKGMLVLVLLNVAIGLAVLLVQLPTLAVRGAVLGTGLPAALLMVLFLPGWDPKIMASGVAVYLPMYYTTSEQFKQRNLDPEILFYEDGMSVTVTVQHRKGKDELMYLRLNGKVDASTGIDMLTQLLCGYLPVMLHPNPKSVFILGMGSGVTVGAVTQTPVKEITVVELEPAVVRASRFFESFNSRYWEDPRVRIVIHDGRSYLLANPQRYDVIISEPTNPWIAGVANLFTTEFFDLVKQRLAPKGVYIQWVQQYQLSTQSFKTILATLVDRFPYVGVFALTGVTDTLLVASHEPLNLSPELLQSRMDTWGVQPTLAKLKVGNAYDLLAMYSVGRQEVMSLTTGSPHNTDDNGLLEFAAPKEIYLYFMGEIDNVFFGFKPVPPYRQMLRRPSAGQQRRSVEEQLAEGYKRQGAENAASGRPYLALAQLLYAKQLNPRSSAIHNALANVYLVMGQKAKGAAHLKEAIRLDPKNAKPVFNYAAFLEEAGALDEAIEQYQRVIKIDREGEAAERAKARLRELGGVKGQLLADPSRQGAPAKGS